MPSSTSELLKFLPDKFALESMIFRNEKGLTRKEMGALLQVPESRITNYEIKHNFPSIDTIINFCQVSGKDVYEFFEKK